MMTLPTFSKNERLTAEKLQALVEAIKELQNASGGGGNQTATPDEPVKDLDVHRVFPAKITGFDGSNPTKHTWQEQINNSGSGLEDYADGVACTDATDGSAATELNLTPSIAPGTYVSMMEICSQTAYRYSFSVGGVSSITTNTYTAEKWIEISDTNVIKHIGPLGLADDPDVGSRVTWQPVTLGKDGGGNVTIVLNDKKTFDSRGHLQSGEQAGSGSSGTDSQIITLSATDFLTAVSVTATCNDDGTITINVTPTTAKGLSS